MHRHARRVLSVLILTLCFSVPTVAESAADDATDTAADEAAIHALIESWSAASEAKDASAG